MQRPLPAFFSSVYLLLTALIPFAAHAQDSLPRSVVLSDDWRFQPDPLRVGDTEHWERPDFDRSRWREVEVPNAWDFYDPVMDGYEGVVWYALELPSSSIQKDSRQTLYFGRANYKANVWINGVPAGENLCGYVPFEVPLTPWITTGDPVDIVVRVENGPRYEWLPGTTTVEWVQYGGLLEPVELITTQPIYVERLFLDAAPRAGDADVNARVRVRNASGRPADVLVRVRIDGHTAESTVIIPDASSSEATMRMTLPDARFWTPDTPNLYDAEAVLVSGGTEVDRVSDRFGVRSVRAEGRRILLNDSPLHVRGVNRYDEFPGTGPVADEARIRADLEAVKATGANLIRVHYPQSPAHLRIADEIGLLYMEEVPLNWWRAPWHPPVPPEFENDRIIDAAEQTLVEMVGRDYNHPSLVIWSMANECQTADELGTQAMERLLRRARLLDTTRLLTYVANRDIEGNRAFEWADIVCVNLYFGMWDGQVARTMSDMEDCVYRPTREALDRICGRFDTKPIVVTEFGTIGVPGSHGDSRFTEDFQASYLGAAWRAIRDTTQVSGGIVWSWADYRHRSGFTNDFPSEYGPFGLVNLERRPKMSLDTMRLLWSADSRPTR